MENREQFNEFVEMIASMATECMLDTLEAPVFYTNLKSALRVMAEKFPELSTEPDDEVIRLEHLKRLHLGPEDFLVLETPMALTEKHVEHLSELVKSVFGEDRKLIVLEEGMKLGMERDEEQRLIDAGRQLEQIAAEPMANAARKLEQDLLTSLPEIPAGLADAWMAFRHELRVYDKERGVLRRLVVRDREKEAEKNDGWTYWKIEKRGE